MNSNYRRLWSPTVSAFSVSATSAATAWAFLWARYKQLHAPSSLCVFDCILSTQLYKTRANHV